MLQAGDQAPDFSLPSADMHVAGVSADSCHDHQAFRDKYGLRVNLLADIEQEVCNAYGVIHEKEKDGVIRKGILRSTFVIDPDGIIRYAEYGVLRARAIIRTGWTAGF